MPDWSRHADDELIKIAQAGNAEAFGEIYNRYAQSIFRYLYAHLNERQDAEDLMADVFLRTWQALPEYQRRKGVPFYVFLYRIARNRLIDYYRRNEVRKLDVTLDKTLGENQEPLQTATEDIEHSIVHHFLEKLREDYRTVISLRFLSGLSPEETAAVMDKSVGAVRVLQHRALAALQRLMKEADNE